MAPDRRLVFVFGADGKSAGAEKTGERQKGEDREVRLFHGSERGWLAHHDITREGVGNKCFSFGPLEIGGDGGVSGGGVGRRL